MAGNRGLLCFFPLGWLKQQRFRASLDCPWGLSCKGGIRSHARWPNPQNLGAKPHLRSCLPHFADWTTTFSAPMKALSYSALVPKHPSMHVPRSFIPRIMLCVRDSRGGNYCPDQHGASTSPKRPTTLSKIHQGGLWAERFSNCQTQLAV